MHQTLDKEPKQSDDSLKKHSVYIGDFSLLKTAQRPKQLDNKTAKAKDVAITQASSRRLMSD